MQIVVNLNQARLEQVNPSETHRRPGPAPTLLRIVQVDHARSRVFAVQRHGFWVLMRRDDAAQQAIDAAYASAQAP